MPKLSYPKITKGDAIKALLNLYRKEPDFMKELEEIRQPYAAILSKFAKDAFALFSDGTMSPAKYYQAVIDYSKGMSKKDPFPTQNFSHWSQLQPYLNSLGELAYKWKLRAPWAVIILSYLDLIDLLKAQGLPDEIDIPLENLESIYPWAPPLPPLEIKIPAWAIILSGHQAVQTEVNKKLQEYEKEIKDKGLREYPSGLKKHAYWWFQYNVKGKRWVDLANEEAQDDPEGGPHPENIRKAASRFSKLIGIQTNVKKKQ